MLDGIMIVDQVDYSRVQRLGGKHMRYRLDDYHAISTVTLTCINKGIVAKFITDAIRTAKRALPPLPGAEPYPAYLYPLLAVTVPIHAWCLEPNPLVLSPSAARSPFT